MAPKRGLTSRLDVIFFRKHIDPVLVTKKESQSPAPPLPRSGSDGSLKDPAAANGFCPSLVQKNIKISMLYII